MVCLRDWTLQPEVSEYLDGSTTAQRPGCRETCMCALWFSHCSVGGAWPQRGLDRRINRIREACSFRTGSSRR